MSKFVYVDGGGQLSTDDGPVEVHERNRGVVVHDWATDGWGPYSAVTISADGAQSFATSVSGGRGIVTGTGAGNGSHRVAYLRRGTAWRDATITTLIDGPTAAWDGSNAQQGHLHRVREISPGVWEAIAVWTSVVFGGDYSYLHAKAVRFDGTTLSQSAGGDNAGVLFAAVDAGFIDNRTEVIAHRRFTFGSAITEFRCRDPERVRHLVVPDPITTAGLTDSGFNKSAIALNSDVTATGIAQIVDPTSGDTAWTADAVGTLTPAGGSSQKRWAPFWLSTRVVGGTASGVVVEAKRWRPVEGEPAWSDRRVQRGSVTTNGSVPTLPLSPGRCGLWAAHFHDSSGGAWGECRFERVDGEP